MKTMDRIVSATLASLALSLCAPGTFVESPAAEVEIREYRGERLDPYDREYENSILGPQKVDAATYRLRVGGLVAKPLSMAYGEVLALPPVSRVMTLHCVEGWSEKLLFEGVRLADLLALAGPAPRAATVIFRAADGYSSSLPLDYIRRRDIMLIARVNGRTLDAKRGFPFQVGAESKFGYKWVRWVEEITLSDKPHRGYWESRGYSDEADLP